MLALRFHLKSYVRNKWWKESPQAVKVLSSAKAAVNIHKPIVAKKPVKTLPQTQCPDACGEFPRKQPPKFIANQYTL